MTKKRANFLTSDFMNLSRKILSRDEEVGLGRKIQNGNPAEKLSARNELIEHNIRLTISISKKIQRSRPAFCRPYSNR